MNVSLNGERLGRGQEGEHNWRSNDPNKTL